MLAWLTHLLCSSGSVLFIVEHGERIGVGVAHKLTNDRALKSVDKECTRSWQSFQFC